MERLGTPPDAKVIVPGECMEMPGEGTPDEPYRMQPQIDPSIANALACTDLGLFVTATAPQFDAVVDEILPVSLPTKREFMDIGEALAYLDGLGMESVNILVRDGSYVEAANFASPAHVHLFGLRGGAGTAAGLSDGQSISWELGGFRPLNSLLTRPNFYIHNFGNFNLGAQTTQPFDNLQLWNTYMQCNGVWAVPLCTWLVATDSMIHVSQTKTLASGALGGGRLGMAFLSNTEVDIGGQAGSGADVILGTDALYHDGSLICFSNSGTHNLFLPPRFEIVVRDPSLRNRSAASSLGTLNLIVGVDSQGRIDTVGMGFTPGSYNVTSASATDKLRLEGPFNTIDISGACDDLHLDVTAAAVTVAAPPTGELPHFLAIKSEALLTLTGPATLDLSVADGAKLILTNKMSGHIIGRRLNSASGTFLTGVNMDGSSLGVAALGTDATGTFIPYALDAATSNAVFVWHGRSTWANPGTDAGTGNRFLPEGAAPPAAGFAPADATYLVTTADPTLTNEVVVGATPAGELGGTWASPTVDIAHGWTAGSVIFADGSGDLTQDNAAFSYDSANDRMSAADLVVGSITAVLGGLDFFGIAHEDNTGDNVSYALIQNGGGLTILNAKVGQLISIRVNSVEVFAVRTADVRFAKKIYPSTPAGAQQTVCGIYAGTGVPNNADGANGDIYWNAAGGALTTQYQKRLGVWVGIL